MPNWNAHDEAMAAEAGISVEEYLRRGKEEALKAATEFHISGPVLMPPGPIQVARPETHCSKCGVSHELRELMERLFREWLMKRLEGDR